MSSLTQAEALERYREIQQHIDGTEALIKDLEAEVRSMRQRQRGLASSVAWGNVAPEQPEGTEQHG